MKGLTSCPNCWGTGFRAGFGAQCFIAPLDVGGVVSEFYRELAEQERKLMRDVLRASGVPYDEGEARRQWK